MILSPKQLKTIREFTAAKAVYEMACAMLEAGIPLDNVRLATDKAFYALEFKHNPLFQLDGINHGKS